MKRIMVLVLAAAFVLGTAASFAEGKYADGLYEGEEGFIKVQVGIQDGAISDIKIVEHGGGGEKYENMVKPMLDEMVKKQSTDVDAVSGATVSSGYLKEAVAKALAKAAK